jgi:hypothetical protein
VLPGARRRESGSERISKKPADMIASWWRVDNLYVSAFTT